MSGLGVALLTLGFGVILFLLIWGMSILNERVQALEDEIYVRNQGWRTEWLADVPTTLQQHQFTTDEQPSSTAGLPGTWPQWR